MFYALKIKRRYKVPLIIAAVLLAVAVVIHFASGDTAKTSGDDAGMFTLVIDAGHGGVDGGAVGADGSKESNINLAIALKLRALAEFYGQENVLVRQDDSTLSTTADYSEHDDLVNRTAVVNAASNPVLVSIHQNCFPTGQPSGPQVLYGSSSNSEGFGKLTHSNLISCLDPANRRVAEPVSDGLYIFSHINCPAILVECGFMSNFSDIGKLNDPSYQAALATVLMASYLQYISGETNI